MEPPNQENRSEVLTITGQVSAALAAKCVIRNTMQASSTNDQGQTIDSLKFNSCIVHENILPGLEIRKHDSMNISNNRAKSKVLEPGGKWIAGNFR